MALLTPLDLAEARALADRYGLEVRALRPVPHGSVNSNFELELEDGSRRFLRIYEESAREEVERQNRLLAALVAGGVRTPAPLALRDGGTLAEHGGKPVALFPYVEGHWSCQRAVDEPRAAAVGEALARLHRAGEGYADAPPTRFGFAALRARLDGLVPEGLPQEVGRALVLLRDRLDELEPALAAAPDALVVHGDLFRDNVLWRDHELTALLDFESASRGDAAFDLMVTMHAWCFGSELERSLARALVAGYQRVRPLTGDESDSAWLQARAAAVRFAVTRITDYELRPRGVVVYKDFRRFLARLRAVEAIGASAFPSWIGSR